MLHNLKLKEKNDHESYLYSINCCCHCSGTSFYGCTLINIDTSPLHKGKYTFFLLNHQLGTFMKKILFTTVITTAMLLAQDLNTSKECVALTKSIDLMSKATEINHKNIEMLVDILAHEKDDSKKANAKKALQDMNEKTKTRSVNAKYPEIYKELKKSYEVNCGKFTTQNSATLDSMIDRSINFNNILAKELGDALSLSKIKSDLSPQEK